MEQHGVIFDFRNVTSGFQLCFLADCPKHGECLRYMAGEHLPPKSKWGPAIYPTIERDENGCRFFKTSQPKHMAWGFDTLFRDVLTRNAADLRAAIKEYLGGNGTYYRYKNGDRLLTPEQQKWIIDLFKKAGYSKNLEFDHYADVYDFDH